MAINNLAKVKKEDCAFLIIDMQNDFILEGAPIEACNGRTIIPAIAKFKAYCAEQGIPVIYTRETHRKEQIDYGLELEREEPLHCLEGTDGIEIISQLQPKEGDFVVKKPRYSGFYATDMEILLQGLHKKTVILSGVGTNVCVHATAIDAQQRGFRVVALSDCIAGATAELHKAFLRNIEYVLGDVVTADVLIDHFSHK